MKPTKLCSVDDIPLDGARGFTIDINAGPVLVFVVSEGDAIHAYITSAQITGHCSVLKMDYAFMVPA